MPPPLVDQSTEEDTILGGGLALADAPQGFIIKPCQIVHLSDASLKCRGKCQGCFVLDPPVMSLGTP